MFSLHYFSLLSSGKSRDELGREVIDPVMVKLGPRAGARELNERSPQTSPRKRNTSVERAPQGDASRMAMAHG